MINQFLLTVKEEEKGTNQIMIFFYIQLTCSCSIDLEPGNSQIHAVNSQKVAAKHIYKLERYGILIRNDLQNLVLNLAEKHVFRRLLCCAGLRHVMFNKSCTLTYHLFEEIPRIYFQTSRHKFNNSFSICKISKLYINKEKGFIAHIKR